MKATTFDPLCNYCYEENEYISKCKQQSQMQNNLLLVPLLIFPLQYSGCLHMLHGASHDELAVYQLI